MIALALLTTLALAADDAATRPDESSMFGGANDATSASQPPVPNAETESKADTPETILQIGGRYYQRLILSGQRGMGMAKSPIAAPLQFDGFLDARPNDQLRGFINSRLLYDPTRDQFSRATGGASLGTNTTTTTSAPPSGVTAAAIVPNNPQVVLDQAWLKFDISRSVFVTAGRQHVKWGTGRFWNPTDFLHTQRRDPLLPYDLRLGNTMVKFEIPWEAKKTNLYAMLLLDNPQPASTLEQVGGAFRYEKVLGDGEIGLEAVFRGGVTPTYGADFSTGLGPFDLFAEVAVFTNSQLPRLSIDANGILPNVELTNIITQLDGKGPFFQVTLGGNHQFGWKDNRTATVGLEYFYNQLGVNDPRIYPVLIYLGQFQPFYTGKNYAAAYLTAEGPDSERRTTYTLSQIANFSDKSFLTRLDFSWRLLTYLTFEAFVDAHYGTLGGEFNFAVNTSTFRYNGATVPAINVPSTASNVGLGLRMSF